MRKYEPEVFVNAWGVQVLDMVESKRGEYVEAKEAEKLEQLNEEMLDALKSAKWIIQALQIVIHGHTEDNSFMQHLQSIIKKAEEV